MERARGLMDQAARDCPGTGYETPISALGPPDPDDGHVLSAVIAARFTVGILGVRFSIRRSVGSAFRLLRPSIQPEDPT